MAIGKPAQPISHMVGFGIKDEISMEREGESRSGQTIEYHSKNIDRLQLTENRPDNREILPTLRKIHL